MPEAIPAIILAIQAAGSAIAAGDVAALAAAVTALGDTVLIADAGVLGTVTLSTAVEVGGLIGLGVAGLLSAPKAPTPQAIGFPVKQPIPPRRSGYGRCRVSGAYLLFGVATDGTSTDVLAVHDGLIDGYEWFYLNDDRVTLSGGYVVCPGNPDGRYDCKDETMVSDKLQILTTLGPTPNTAITSIAGSAMPAGWDASHRGDGIATIALGCRTPKLTYYDTIYPNGLPQLGAAARLSPIHDWRDGAQLETDRSTWTWKRNPILQLADYLAHAEGGMGLSWARRIVPAVSTWTAAADDCDSSVEVIHQSGVLTVKAAAGTRMLQLSNVAGLAAGIEIEIGTAAATLETGTVQSVSGGSVTLAADLASDHSAYQFCSWASDPGDPPTEPRYTADGVYEWTSAPSDVVGKLLAACDGWLGQRGDGALVVRSGRYETPTVTLGADAIVSYTLQRFVEDESAVNSYSVKFTSPDHDFSTVEADPWRDEDDIAIRGEKPKDLTLDWVTSYSQARRLAKRAAARDLATERGTVTTNLMGMDALGERYVHLTLEEDEGLILFDGPVEIQSGATIDLTSCTLTFPWIAADPDVDDWVAEVEEGNPPSAGDWTALDPLARPTITAVNVDFAQVANGAGGAALRVSVAALSRDDLTFALRWRVSDGFWTEVAFSDIDDTGGVVLTTGFVVANATIQVEVAYATGDGRSSGWSDTYTASTTPTSTTHPALSAPTGVSASGGATDGVVTFAAVTGAAGYLVAYSDTPGWNAYTYGSIIPAGGSPAYIHGLPAGTYYTRVYAYDLWVRDVRQLNASTEVSFAITTGNGSTPSGGGGGGGGGGYSTGVGPIYQD